MIALLAAPDREDIRAKHPTLVLMEFVGASLHFLSFFGYSPLYLLHSLLLN
jgi:hypothetical protein